LGSGTTIWALGLTFRTIFSVLEMNVLIAFLICEREMFFLGLPLRAFLAGFERMFIIVENGKN